MFSAIRVHVDVGQCGRTSDEQPPSNFRHLVLIHVRVSQRRLP